MADKFIQVPANIEDPIILKRFITELVDKLNSNASIAYPILYPTGYLGNIPQYYARELGNYTNTILEASAKLDTLSGEAKNYITGNLQTQVLTNSEDIATITTQFGTFYDNATAAAWYGLTVKTGELISGFTVGGVDTDTTTPGTAGSFFAISADKFSVGRAIADINDPAELAYVQANNLPYGTMYDVSTNKIIPAFLIEWTGTNYDIFFNGRTEFSNYLTPGTTTIDGSYLTTGTVKTTTPDGQFYSVLEGGSLSFYKTGNATPYKYLKHIQTGTAIAAGSTVTLNGFFGSVPNIMVSSNSLATYDPLYADRVQVQNIGYSDLVGSVSTGIWTFKPTSELSLSASNITIGSLSSAQSIDYTKAAYGTAVYTYTNSVITPTLTTKIQITGGIFGTNYARYTDASSFLYMGTFVATLQYSLDNSTWTNANSVSASWYIGYKNAVTINSASASGLTTPTLPANTYYYRVMIASSPADLSVGSRVDTWDEAGSYFYMSASGLTSYYTTTGTTILQSGFLNYIAIG